jgi:hypothetical protein
MEQIPEFKKVVESKDENINYLYHMVPPDMEGNMLHPLTTLKKTHPHLYIRKAEKYKDRPEIMENFIPTLECMWNDVFHFSPIDPKELKAALVEAGRSPQEMKFYQIDPKLLDTKLTTIYLYRDSTKDYNGDRMNSDNFSKYNPNVLGEHATIPEGTKAYYKKMYSKGKKPLLFLGIPHILHKGSLDISDLPVITV